VADKLPQILMKDVGMVFWKLEILIKPTDLDNCLFWVAKREIKLNGVHMSNKLNISFLVKIEPDNKVSKNLLNIALLKKYNIEQIPP